MRDCINKNLIVISILHLIVDFLCVGSLILAFNTFDDRIQTFTYIFLLYNCLAFLTQPFFGMLADHFKGANQSTMLKAFMLLSSGVLLIGWLIMTVQYWLHSNEAMVYVSAGILGIGNGFFHATAGKESLMFTTKATPGGLFVSTGALGVGLGGILFVGKFLILLFVYFLVAPIILIVLSLIHLQTLEEKPLLKYEVMPNKKIPLLSLIVIILCLAIAVRSFLGFYAIMSTDVTGWGPVLLLSVAVFIGKAIGGLILDLIGPYALIILSTVIATVTSIFLPIIYLDYVFMISFNMLMPLTLDALRKCFPNKEGFSFGFAAAFLIPGYLVGSALKGYGMQSIIIPIICFITGGILIISYVVRSKIIEKC